MALEIIIFAALCVLFVFCLAVFASAFIANKSASPFWPTPEDAVRRALAEAGVKKGDVVYDLGAGTGSVVLVADRDFSAEAHGYEISLLFYLIARLRIIASNSKAKMHFKSFFDADLGKADFIFCFLMGRAIIKLRPQIERQAKPGARVVSYRFRFHGWEPIKTIEIEPGKKIYIYETGRN